MRGESSYHRAFVFPQAAKTYQPPADEELITTIRKDPELQLEYIRKLQAGEPVERLLLQVHRPIVQSYVNRWHRFGRDWADLWQEGRLGVLRALYGYDASQGASPYTWINIWVRSRVSRFITMQGSVVHLPVHVYNQRRHPGIREKFPNLSIKRSRSILFSELEQAYATSTYDEVKSIFEETLVDEADLADSLLEDEDISQWCQYLAQKLFESLNERQRDIIVRRFFYEDGEGQTLLEIGEHYGLSRERIRQVEADAFERFHEILKFRKCSVGKYRHFRDWVAALARVDWDMPLLGHGPLGLPEAVPPPPPEPEPEPVKRGRGRPKGSHDTKPRKIRQKPVSTPLQEALAEARASNQARIKEIAKPKKQLDPYPKPVVVQLGKDEEWAIPCTVASCENGATAMIVSKRHGKKFFACADHVFEIFGRA